MIEEEKIMDNRAFAWFIATFVSLSMVTLCNSALGAQFKADMVMGQSGSTKTGKFYIKGSKYRMEQRDDGQQIVVLVDQDEGLTRVLMK